MTASSTEATVTRRDGTVGKVERQVDDRLFVRWPDGTATWEWTAAARAAQQAGYNRRDEARAALARLDAVIANPKIDYAALVKAHIAQHGEGVLHRAPSEDFQKLAAASLGVKPEKPAAQAPKEKYADMNKLVVEAVDRRVRELRR